MKTITLLILTAFITATRAPQAFAWGGLGHRIAAETAAILTQDTQWQEFLSKHRFELGYYSMAPDVFFRFQDEKEKLKEGPTHYLDVDLLFGLLVGSKKFKTMPPELKDPEFLWSLKNVKQVFSKRLSEKFPGTDMFQKIGSAPWRVEQLLSLAKTSFEEAARGELTGTGFQRGTNATGSNRKIFDGLYYLGILSHYTSDIFMPYHATEDYNGWKTGQGGIHFYFETDCVNALEPGISVRVLSQARKNYAQWKKEFELGEKNFSAPKSAMLALWNSFQALDILRTLDRKHALIQASRESQDSGEKEKKSARRKTPALGCKPMEAFLTERLALSAVFTALIWEKTFPEKSIKNLGTLQFSDLLASPDFIKPSYLEESP